MSDNDKQQIGLRLPKEMVERIESYVKQIGISKQAFILSLIYKELKKEDARPK